MKLPALALLTLSAFAATAQAIQVNKDNRTIAVTATDKVTAMADVASVHIGFIAYGPDSASAYTAGSTISNAIHKTLLAAGVAEDSIESENQGVSPVPDYQSEKWTPEQKSRGKFQVVQSWTVRTNAADASKVLDLAVKAGANQSGQINWSLKDENAPAAEAAAKALQRARTVADQMARGLNAKLGALIYASNETEAEPVRPLNGRPVVYALAQKVAEPLAINPRQIEKSANCSCRLRHRIASNQRTPLVPMPPPLDLKPTPEAEATFRRWIAHLNDEFGRHASPDRRSEIVRDELFQLYLGRPHGGKVVATLTSELATSVLMESFDPRNVTLAAEHEDGVDAEQFAPRKPLLYFWQMFDRSPLGLNHWLGLRFRCMLGRHIFRSVGKGVKIFHGVEFSRGYTVSIEDNCTIESNVQLDDRQELLLSQGTIVAAGTRPYPLKDETKA